MASDAPIKIGVLALQGSFREHIALLRQIPGIEPIEVRKKEELRGCAGLIIPGGESTTMALVAEQWGLIPELQQFVTENHRPVWGTCAGLIFLANKATGTKEGGQALLGGLDCTVHRNFFGAQINSFETQLDIPSCLPDDGQHGDKFRAVFIRAPAITQVGPGVEVLAQYQLTPEEREAQKRDSVIVGVRSGHILATSFHPELTQDTRWHRLFVEMVKKDAAALAAQEEGNGVGGSTTSLVGRPPNEPGDLPVYNN